MDNAQLHAAFKAALTSHLRGMTAEQQADFMSCLMTAAVAVLPAFLAAMLKCMAGQAAPPTTGFDPGDRTRCD